MSLYETWQQVAQSQRTREEYDAFWGTYFEAEKQRVRGRFKSLRQRRSNEQVVASKT